MKTEGIKLDLICKILNYKPGHTLAANTLESIARVVDEEELKRLKGLTKSVFSEAKKQPPETMLKVATERIGCVFDCVCELRLKGFLKLEEIIAEAAMPFENGKPIAELKEITTEAIKFILEGRLQQEELEGYMKLKIDTICTLRETREYEELWERAKDASVDKTVELIYQAIQRMEAKMKADWHKSEQNGTTDTVQEINSMIKVSLFEAGVQQDTSEWSEILKDLIEVFSKQGILYRGSDEQYELCLKASESLKSRGN